MRVSVRIKVATTIVLDGLTKSIVCLLHKEEISGLGFGSGLGQIMCCAM